MSITKQNIRNFASSKDCTGCMACIDSCNYNAITYGLSTKGYIKIYVNNKACVGCAKCISVCPQLSCHQYSTENKLANGYAVWNNDVEQRKTSASGGAFSAIATYILKNGGIVYGAALDGFEVKHIRIDNVVDLVLLQNAKYQHSITKGIYKSVRRDLILGNIVLFSGLGCQVAALYSFLGKISTENLYTIDTICGGVSTILPMLELKHSGKYHGILSFRDKEKHGWSSKGFSYRLKMVGKYGNEVDLGNNNLVLNSFSSKILKRSSCLNCQFVGLQRNSGCTVGDFWGDKCFKSQHSNGLSAIIIHDSKMENLLKKCNLSLKPVDVESIASGNPNLFYGNFKGIRYLLSRHLSFIFLKCRINKWAYALSDWNSIFSLEMRMYMRFIHKYIKKAFMLQIKQIRK